MLDIIQILNGLDSYRFSTEEELDNLESLSYFIDEILDIGDFKFVWEVGPRQLSCSRLLLGLLDRARVVMGTKSSYRQ